MYFSVTIKITNNEKNFWDNFIYVYNILWNIYDSLWFHYAFKPAIKLDFFFYHVQLDR